MAENGVESGENGKLTGKNVEKDRGNRENGGEKWSLVRRGKCDANQRPMGVKWGAKWGNARDREREAIPLSVSIPPILGPTLPLRGESPDACKRPPTR